MDFNIKVIPNISSLMIQLLSTFILIALLVGFGYLIYTVTFKIPKKMSKIETELQSLNESIKRIDKLSNSDK